MFMKPKKSFSLLLVSVMVLSLFLSGNLLSPPEVAAAVGNVTNYEFDDLPYNDTYNLNWDPTDTSLPGWNVNWNYDWAKPQKGMRVIPSTTPLGLIFEPINGNASSTVNGEYVRFNFEVPDGGWYNIDLTYFKYYGGSTCDIMLDNITVVSGFSFYAATKSSLLTQNIKTGFKLKEGRHTLTFKCTGTSQISGLYYNFFYLNKLTLTQVRGTTYKFTNLPDNNPTIATWDPTDSANAGYDPDWHYAKTSPARGLRLVGETLQLVNQAPTGAVNGEFITVNFDVPEGGTYNLYLTSFKNIAGGTYRIKVDSTTVKSSHSFYASAGTSPATEALATGISLTKGLHELTFELLSTVKLASNNLYYGYLYLTDLQLELTASSNTNSKTSTGYYTDTRVNAARANVNNYTWAADIRDAAVAAADQYLAKGNDWIWSLPTAQSLPRGYAVNQSLGCLNCGSAINTYGNYPYLADPFTSPWKLECPNCHMKFPTNDFESYYNSGLDHHGVFNPALANSSYLVNTAYPERGASWGVDNGWGYVDGSGNKYTFVAYYNHWFRWYSKVGSVSHALGSLKDAYIYTGDMDYGRAGAILLDRIADLYPSMDTTAYPKANGFFNSDGGSGVGKVVGCIWECGLVNGFCMAYDALFPAMTDSQLISYLSAKNNIYNISAMKYSAEGIRQNIEDGVLNQVYPNMKKAYIRGNNGMHQGALAAAAVSLNSLPLTKIWLDFDFKSGDFLTSPYRITGGNIYSLLVDDVDVDGSGTEGSTGYNNGWFGNFELTANILDGYSLYPGADLYQNVKFQRMFYATIKHLMSNVYSLQYGDSGSTGKPQTYLNMDRLIKAYGKYSDPLFAQAAYLLNGNTSVGIHGSIFTPNAGDVATSVQSVINANGQLSLDSENLTGSGVAMLREYSSGNTDERDLWTYYGITSSHGQRDALNLGMFAFGLDVLPELGYPEYADSTYPRTNEWEKHTISHNTVLVNKTRQTAQTLPGDPKHFDSAQRVKFMDIENPGVYSQTSLYKRRTAMIKVDETNSYAVDFFRVIGGTDHHFSFHAAEGPVTTSGLTLVPQKSGGVYVGSYAGSTVPFGVRPTNDSVSGSGYTGPGFHWLKNVDKATNPATTFSAEWDITDTWNALPVPMDVRLRLTMLGSYNDVSLADGIPPQNKPGNPASIRYLIAHRTGTNLDSLFTSVIEPFIGTRYISSISAATVKQAGVVVTNNTVRAVKVVLVNGRTDYIVSADNPSTTYTVDDKFTFKGAFGVYSEAGGVQNYAYVNEGTQIGNLITTAVQKYTGTITGFTNTLSASNTISVNINEAGYSAADLVGRYIYINNDGVRNAVYKILGTSGQSGSSITLDIGKVTPIRSYKDSNDFTKGFNFDFVNGATFSIPLSKELIQ